DLITRVLAPRIAGREFDSPEAVDVALRENVRGNPFARAGIETAAWDLEAHRRGTGLPQLVAERLGVAPRASFPCGVALGIPDELVGHARLAHALKTPLCLDETLRDSGVARQILALDGPMVWNLKVHRVGGLAEACRLCRVAADGGARLWAGTMPESGIGSQA